MLTPILGALFRPGYEHMILYKLLNWTTKQYWIDINKNKSEPIFNDPEWICFQLFRIVLEYLGFLGFLQQPHPRKGGHPARFQNRLLDTQIWQEFTAGAKYLLPYNHNLFGLHSIHKVLDNTLLWKREING